MGSVSLWQEWYNEEIENHDADGNSIADFYRDLITNPIEEEPIVLVKNGKGYIWDGFHRI